MLLCRLLGLITGLHGRRGIRLPSRMKRPAGGIDLDVRRTLAVPEGGACHPRTYSDMRSKIASSRNGRKPGSGAEGVAAQCPQCEKNGRNSAFGIKLASLLAWVSAKYMSVVAGMTIMRAFMALSAVGKSP